ncbi:MAG: hypothetical protein JNL11_08950 [Bdellovibrionaceae bacterium]|nr:hypothetical protein [Pseudobdellovibrionaceae bacterium]
MNQKELHLFVASQSYENDLKAEIRFRRNLELVKQEENLFWAIGPKQKLWWPQWQLWNLQSTKFESISQAIKFLRSRGKLWLNFDYKLHRRSSLIQEGLPKWKIPVIKRDEKTLFRDSGAWFLEDSNTLWYTNQISLPFKDGIINIPEDKMAPSRAFQKLDEAFVRIGKRPIKTSRVIDLGSHPGGWTWVLAQLAGKVVSVDTVALDENARNFKNVEFIKKDAFKIAPNDIGPLDWLFSDIICEPAKLLDLVHQWKSSGLVKNFLCTIKFKGKVDFEILNQFEQIPNSDIFHLNANKHELTWVCLD